MPRHDARHIVEIGTSHGVSTLYLAAVLRENLRAGGEGVVIGTEYEPAKTAAARAHFAEAGLADLIDMREGGYARRCIGSTDRSISCWSTSGSRWPELVAPHLRRGAIVVCDNTAAHRDAYADYFAFINDPANGFRTMTQPFDGGFELSVRCGG